MRLSLLLTLLLCLPVLPVKATVEFSPTCTIIYSLQRNAESYFIDEVTQLDAQLKRQNIHLIDLNNWYYEAPYLSVTGRERSLLRERYQLPANTNQAVVLDSKGFEISRHTGSVTLVTLVLACPE
ncbi:hypothetical protein [Paraglaciecola hydrolytica]|uniref:Uncharacterized protein n=1 Tax=Paraglaciecola hydrolytica TaxID=1799789 RepID=A0A136A505_9ALTE|nr:hypothetical protein [Paraglaciecola hydrolytica]KXI30301.1 hypothetical protein AX660_09995 [Paraglaciecola hydrolytica]